MLTPPPSQPSNPNDRNRQKGTGFTNISKVLGANQGAGQKMGQKIGSSLSGQAGAIKQGIEQGKSQFQAGMQQNAEQAKSAIAGGQALQQQEGEQADAYAKRLAGVGQPPTQGQPVDISKQGEAFRTASYTGPTGLQSAGQLSSKAATASALGQLGATGAGQGQLLASQVAQRGGYGRGQGALDQLLLGKTGQQEIQKGRSALSGIQGQTQGAIQAAQAQAAATGQAIDTSKTATQQALYNQLSGTGEAGAPKGFTTQAKEQAQAYNTEGTKLQQMLSGRNPDGTLITPENPSKYTEQDLASLDKMQQYGLSPEQTLYGKDDAARANALQGLTSNIDTSQATRYLGDQAGAAQNLASFLGDKGLQGQIGSSKFNEKLFSPVTQQEQIEKNKGLRKEGAQSLKSEYESPALSILNNPGVNTYDLMEQLQPGIRGALDSYLDSTNQNNAGVRQAAFMQTAANLANQRMAESQGRDWDKDSRLSQNEKSLKQIALSRLGKK